MSTGNQRFPRWVGPIIGAVVGVEVGFDCMIWGEQDSLVVIVGAVVGALGGSLLWFLESSEGDGRRASIIGSIFAVFAVITGMVPIAGLLFAIPAFMLNHRVDGWQNRASRLGLGLCVVLTLVVFGTIVGLHR